MSDITFENLSEMSREALYGMPIGMVGAILWAIIQEIKAIREDVLVILAEAGIAP